MLKSLTIVLLLVSCAPKYPHLDRAEELNRDLNSGAMILSNCLYFRRMYPKFYREIVKPRNVYFAFSSSKRYARLYSEAHPEDSTILLTSGYFTVKSALKRQAILGHELLHLIGLPDHSRQHDYTSDPIYTIERICFGETDQLE